MAPLPEGMTPSQVGERAEAAVLAALAASGKHVLVPFGQHRYDLAFEGDGRLVRVQCKSGVVRSGALWFRTHSVVHGSSRDYREDVDFFGVYCHDRGEVYLVPVDHVPRSAAHLRLQAPRNAQQAGIRWASQYLLNPKDPGSASSSRGHNDRQLSILTDIDESGNMPSMAQEALTTLPIARCPPLAGPTISFEEATGTASLFKALADPHRVLILNRLLASDEPVCVCELNEQLDLAQPTVSFHLKKMVNAGLLQREKRATWAYYSVTPAAVEALSELFKVKETA